jgi:hypothetical protein
MLMALLLATAGWAADDSRESASFIKILEKLQSESTPDGIANAGTADSDVFYLGKSEYFSAEVTVTSTNAITYDLVLMYEDANGTFIVDPDGDIVSAHTQTFDFHTLSPDYTTRGLKIRVTNNDTSYIDAEVYLHRDSPARLK